MIDTLHTYSTEPEYDDDMGMSFILVAVYDKGNDVWEVHREWLDRDGGADMIDEDIDVLTSDMLLIQVAQGYFRKD